jgi:c-di-GMP-binding flagellar brake protein YcgR
MENRRQSYRHPFPESEPVGVEITASEGQPPLRGELLDLSVGGMKIRLDAGHEVSVGGHLTVRAVRRQSPPLRLLLGLAGQVKHVEQEGRHVCLGLQFLPQAMAPADDTREGKLSRFLAEEQRRILRTRIAAQED